MMRDDATTYLMHCGNCGREVVRLVRIKRPMCLGCQRAANHANTAAKRKAARPPRACRVCHVPIPEGTHGSVLYCPPCRVEQYHKRRAEYQARRRGRYTHVADGAFARMRCDRALNRGTCLRRCQSCYTLYRLTTLEAPCPKCGAHLIADPTTFTEVSHEVRTA